jgi:DNA polymerase, archaea type
MSDYSNDLIWGRDKTERVVSCETSEDKLILFTEELDGSVKTEFIENKYWLLTRQKVSSKQSDLDGDLPYKYIAEFDTVEKRNEITTMLRKKNVDFYRIFNSHEQSLVRHGITYFKGMKPNEISVLSFDIETDGLLHHKDSEIYIISNTFRKQNKKVRKLFTLDQYKNQKDMLDAWCSWVREMNPSVMLGHNIYGYDLQYLNHVCSLNNTFLLLGRDNSDIKFNTYTSSKRKDGSQSIEYYDGRIFGREIVDTMFMAISYDIGRKYESYALKTIIKHEGLEKEDRSFVDASRIKYYYYNRHKDPEMWEKVKRYADEDSEDALKLFDLMIPATFYMNQSVSKTFQGMVNSASGSQLNNVLVRGYLQDGHSIPKADEILESIKGGISFAVPGVYRNLYKIDIKSCYPSQILRFKLFDKKKDPKGYFYEMVKHFTYARFELKKLYKETGDSYYKDMDAASKVFINSAYGLLTTMGLNFNAPWMGAKITEESRKIIDMALTWASGYDSIYWFKIFNEKLGKDTTEEEDDAA